MTRPNHGGDYRSRKSRAELSGCVDSAGCYYQVNIWETDENLMALCSRMNQYRDMSVNYVFGSETETLGGETIATWITGSQDRGADG